MLRFRAIVIVRHPVDCILSLYSYHMNGHTNTHIDIMASNGLAGKSISVKSAQQTSRAVPSRYFPSFCQLNSSSDTKCGFCHYLVDFFLSTAHGCALQLTRAHSCMCPM